MSLCKHKHLSTFKRQSYNCSQKEFYFNSLLLSQILNVPETTKKDLKLKPSLVDSNKVILCLDLDETLISSTFQKPTDYDFSCVFRDGNNQRNVVYIKKRPMLDHFLQTVSQFFDVVIFTASLKEYADPILDILDPKNELFRLRLYRDSCSLFCGSYVKDLRLLTSDMDSILIVDDLSCSFLFQPDNAINIPSYNYYSRRHCNCKFDDCLDQVLGILETINSKQQVLSVIEHSLLIF
ncbi:scp1-like small phosphatase 4-related [Anaeramoeba flamelloides]|uniref:Scp1-like small phosphatase 4-related n=1 Tax=Anaeramoeba flamelloides TaxID=1746091 RepID=A0ABQ8YEJ9_9EUKA|nr:scp1-like small phosphatase 4-related [Anaeramoeba flamelloides]